MWLPGQAGDARPEGSLSVVVASPASYAVALASLGFHSAWRAFLAQPAVRCERAFLDRTHRGRARSWETGTPLADFDVVAFSISFELDYIGFASLLAAAGIPIRSVDRRDDDPLVVVGGVCAFLNPEPIADLVDAVLIGGAESLVPPFVNVVAASAGVERASRLRRIADVPGAYVPALYDVERGADGRVVRFRSRDGVPLPVRPAADPSKERMAESVVVSDASHFQDMFLVETSRGCARGCRFCAAGQMRPAARFEAAGDVVAAVRRGLASTRRIGFVSANLGDHPQSMSILAATRDLGAELNVGSLRAESLSEEFAQALTACGVKSVTIAPEAGTEALREIIGKSADDAAILEAVGLLAGVGFSGLKLYFMIGLPGEGEGDVRAIPEFCLEARDVFTRGRPRTRVSVAASAFVPKPRTPFQWVPMCDERTLRDRVTFLRRALEGRARMSFTASGPREARREAVLARGGRELSGAIALAAADGVPWKAALARTGVSPGAIVDREYGEDEILPWEIVDLGVPKRRLLASYRMARSLIETRGRALRG